MTDLIRFNHELLDARERAYPVEVEITRDGTIVQTWCDKTLTSRDREILQEIADEVVLEDRGLAAESYVPARAA